MSKFYVTTSIAYTNAGPHIGHALEMLQGDVMARYRRSKGDDTWFLTGTDEHGAKIDRAAADKGADVKEFVDGISAQFKKLAADLSISNDQFIRTTDDYHEKASQAIWKACEKDIYKKLYEGWYCVGCETFYTDIDVPDHVCPIHKTELEHTKAENYFFALSKYNGQIKKLIETDQVKIRPDARRNELLALLERGLEDISISREKSQLKWGVQVPTDPDHVMYVWFDALTNYISALGYPDTTAEKFVKFWPADVQVIGKDISRHHGCIWVGMLLSAGLPTPKEIFVHGFITSEGHKMSKSLGNVVGPYDVIDKYGVEALRYYLLREIPADADGDFSWERMETVYNTDLANDLGNLVQRTAAMINKYFDGQIGELGPSSHDLMHYDAFMSEHRFDRALAEVWNLVRGLNQYIEDEKPWQVAKDAAEADHLSEILGHLVSELRKVADLAEPFLPGTAAKIRATFADGKVHGEVGILFPKADALEHVQIEVK